MKKVLIYGYSGAGKAVEYSLDEREYEIVGYIDDNVEIQGKTVWGGCPVVGSEHIKDYEYDYIVVAPFWRSKEMLEKLGTHEVPHEKIVIWDEIHKVKKLDYRIAQLRVCSDVIRDNRVDGCCAEVGVYKGEFARYINEYLSDRKLYLFDTFEGFGDQKLERGELRSLSERQKMEFQDTSVAEVLEKMPHQENIEVRKGFFPGTAADISEDTRFAFVSLDCDLYKPIMEGLLFFWPRLSHGGYIFVHDAAGFMWPGAKRAVDEFCKENNAVRLPILDRCLTTIIMK
ncbi:MAG: class I SAM-dependent methyltransferase [Lachnospiraceae bacterium]|nr:class I SAM-dependent methyltransferase [Lachnospiraceae bacterium]